MSNSKLDAAFVFSASPFGDLKFQEGLDAAFAFAAFDKRVGLFFTENSIWALNKRNQVILTGNRDFLSQLGALSIYDIDDVYISQGSLKHIELEANDLRIKATHLSNKQIANILKDCEQVFRF